MKRAGRNKFMISPDYRIPSGESVLKIVEEWNALEPRDETIDTPEKRTKPPKNYR